MAYERSTAQKKLSDNEDGRAAMQNREELRKLLSMESKDANEVQKWQVPMQKMLEDERVTCMTATKEDFVQALLKKQRAMTLKQSVMQAQKDRNSKIGNWFYEAIKIDITIDDLIAYENKCLSMIANADRRQPHIDRKNFLADQKTKIEAEQKKIHNLRKKCYMTPFRLIWEKLVKHKIMSSFLLIKALGSRKMFSSALTKRMLLFRNCSKVRIGHLKKQKTCRS